MMRRPASDRAALLLAIGVHGLIVLLLLCARGRPAPAPAAPAVLTVFDVAVPPPPLPVVRPALPPPLPALRPGGATATASRRSPLMAMDATPQSLAPPEPAPESPVAAIRSPFADDQGVTQLAGPGTGDGMGRGTGEGAGAGVGDGAGRGHPRYARAEWIAKPDSTEMRAYWPTAAVKFRIDGHADLACLVPRPGKPTRCWVLSESPRNIGFGRAAVAMSHLFRIDPVRRDGDPLDMPVIVPVIYKAATLPKP